MSHPSLGLPPRDLTAGSPSAARRIRDAAPAARRAGAGDRDRPRPDAPRALRRGRPAAAAPRRRAARRADRPRRRRRTIPTPAREYADWTSPVYRRKRVPLDDLIDLCEGLRAALPAVLDAGRAADAAEAAIDEAIAQYRWHRRIAGDARKRNAFLQFIYKGG